MGFPIEFKRETNYILLNEMYKKIKAIVESDEEAEQKINEIKECLGAYEENKI